MPSPPAAFAASDCSSSVFAQCGLTVSCETVVFFSVPLGTAARFDSYSHAVHLTRPVSDDVSIEPHWGQKGNAKDIRRFRGGTGRSQQVRAQRRGGGRGQRKIGVSTRATPRAKRCERGYVHRSHDRPAFLRWRHSAQALAHTACSSLSAPSGWALSAHFGS